MLASGDQAILAPRKECPRPKLGARGSIRASPGYGVLILRSGIRGSVRAQVARDDGVKGRVWLVDERPSVSKMIDDIANASKASSCTCQFQMRARFPRRFGIWGISLAWGSNRVGLCDVGRTESAKESVAPSRATLTHQGGYSAEAKGGMRDGGVAPRRRDSLLPNWKLVRFLANSASP